MPPKKATDQTPKDKFGPLYIAFKSTDDKTLIDDVE